jgi:HTH-type transcriptional regulator / antitoxin MqsA
MKTCAVCGHNGFHLEHVDEVFRVDGNIVLVEDVPAEVCDQCGEATFSKETVEKIRRMTREDIRHAHKVEVEAFAFS